MTEEKEYKPESQRMKRLRDSGLIGSLNDSGATSTNYKESIDAYLRKKFERIRKK